MSATSASLRRKINSAEDLQSVVRTMKALAASSIGQYEKSVRALDDYYRTVELGLGACFRETEPAPLPAQPVGSTHPQRSIGESRNLGKILKTLTRPSDTLSHPPSAVPLRRTGRMGEGRGEGAFGGGFAALGGIGAVVFGSDQGLVGQFNDVVADYAIETLADLRGTARVWAVGERVYVRLADAGRLSPAGLFAVPNSVKAITPLVGQILLSIMGPISELYLFYNRPASGAVYAPVSQRLLPLDDEWRRRLSDLSWPTVNLPEVMGSGTATLRALIREYLFVSLFRACAESLASENASRLAAMERADRNIDELLENLHGTFHRLRQSSIDEELFDVISGFEASTKRKRPQTKPRPRG